MRRRDVQGAGTRPRFLIVGAVIVGILVLQLAAVVWAGVAARGDSEEAARDLMGYVGDATVERVLRVTEPAANLTRELAASADDSGIPTSLVEVEGWLFDHLRYRSGVSGVFIGFEDGSYVSVSRTSVGYEVKVIDVSPVRRVTVRVYDEFHRLLSSKETESDSYDPRARPWYTLAEQSVRLAWTDPMVFFGSGEPGVSATLGVRDEGSVVAVIGAEVRIESLVELLEALPLGGEGDAFILTDRRMVVAVPSRYLDLFEDFRTGETLDVPASALGLPATPPENLNGASSEAIVTGDGQVTLERLFPNESGIHWSLYLRASDADLSAGLGGFQSTMVRLTVLIAGLVLTAAYLLSRLRHPIGVLSARASTDELTGLANRRRLLEQGRALVRSAGEDGERVCVAVFDLDDFKRINDTFGHAVGDEALRVVARALVEASRERDLVARFGGDEFALVRRVTKGASAGPSVERIRSRVEKATRSGETEWGPIGVTAGYTIGGGDSLDLETLLKRADGALISGKTRGKGASFSSR